MGNKLSIAIRDNNVNDVMKLLNNNYSVNESQIMLAIKNENIEILSMLLDAYIINKNNFSFLNEAILKGNYKIVKLLLDHGANPNVYNKNGITSLMLTPPKNKSKIFDLLVEHNADINAKNKYICSDYYDRLPVIGFAIINMNYEYIIKLVKLEVNLLDYFYKDVPIPASTEYGREYVKEMRYILSLCNDISKKLIQNLYDKQLNNIVEKIEYNNTI